MFLCGVLILFFWQSTVSPVRGQSDGGPSKGSPAKVEPSHIVIQKGDTLWSLAQRHRLSLEQLMQINHIDNPDYIRVGQKLRIASSQQSREGVPTEAPRSVEVQAPVKGQTRTFSLEDSGQVQTFEIPMDEEKLTKPQSATPKAADETSSKMTPIPKNETTPSASRGQSIQNQPGTEQAPPNTTSKFEISKEDLDLLARVIYAEARGEDFEGQVAVGAVVLNRLTSGGFPKTIHEVVFQPGAFTAVVDKQIHLTPDEVAYKAAEVALSGLDPTGGALYYFNPKTATDRWIKSRPVVKRIGNHTFSI